MSTSHLYSRTAISHSMRHLAKHSKHPYFLLGTSRTAPGSSMSICSNLAMWDVDFLAQPSDQPGRSTLATSLTWTYQIMALCSCRRCALPYSYPGRHLHRGGIKVECLVVVVVIHVLDLLTRMLSIFFCSYTRIRSTML